MLVKNVMTKDPITISPDISITEAKAIMTKNGIGKLPVVDKNFKLVGMLTKNDLANAVPSPATTLDIYEIGYLLSRLTVKTVMTKEVITVPETEVVEVAAKLMLDKGVGCVPVMKDDLVVGILTESDLFKLFTEMFGANQSGVRFIMSLDDKPGEVSRLVNEIASQNGNLISLVTRELHEDGKRRLSVKVTGITKEQVESILNNLGIQVADIRVN